METNLDIEMACKASEAWCTGTGASITPVGSIEYKGADHVFNGGKVGELSKWVLKTITGIHTEEIEDKWGWTHDPWASK